MKKQRQIELLEAEVERLQQENAALLQDRVDCDYEIEVKIKDVEASLKLRDRARNETRDALALVDKWQKRAISAQHQVATLTTSIQRIETDLGKVRTAIGADRWAEIVGRREIEVTEPSHAEIADRIAKPFTVSRVSRECRFICHDRQSPDMHAVAYWAEDGTITCIPEIASYRGRAGIVTGNLTDIACGNNMVDVLLDEALL